MLGYVDLSWVCYLVACVCIANALLLLVLVLFLFVWLTDALWVHC